MTKEKNAKTFHSWKAIANYFKCSERTVRRWESTQGLPVHRHQHQSASRIFAYQSELDSWFSSRLSQPKPTKELLTSRPRIALLPFRYFGQDDNKSFVAEALCDDIVADLSALPALAVVSLSSMRWLGQSQYEFDKQSSALSLDFYIEGSVHLTEEDSRLHIRLVSTENQSIVWQASYHEKQPDWQRLRQLIVSELVTSLPLSNVGDQLQHSQQLIVSNQTAWEYVHLARSASLQWRPQSITKALELLNAANQLVTDNALILASLGRVYLQLRESGIDCSTAPMEKVSQLLASLQQKHPKAFYTLSLAAWFHYLQGDLNDAIAALKEALLLQPSDADCLALIANCYLLAGLSEMASPYIALLQIVDPFTPLSRCMPGYYRLMKGDFKEAIAPYQQMLELDPENPIARLFLTWVLALNHDEHGVTQVCKGFEASEDKLLAKQIAFALRDHLQGKPVSFCVDDAQVSIISVNGMLARFTAYAYVASGNKEEAVRWLTKAFELGFWAFPYISNHDPFFRELKDFIPMQQLLDRMKSTWQQSVEFHQ